MGLFDRFKRSVNKRSKSDITEEKKFIDSLSSKQFNELILLINSGGFKLQEKSGFKPYWLEQAINQRIEYEQYIDIVNNTSDEKILKEIAQNARYDEIPILCIEKINNNQYLKEIVLKHNSTFSIVSETAINKIEDHKILIDLLPNLPSNNEEIGLDKLNQNELIKIAKDKSLKDSTRIDAINRIHNQSVLMDIFKTEKRDRVRAAALGNMNNLNKTFYNDIVKDSGKEYGNVTIAVAIKHATNVNELRKHTKVKTPDYPPRGAAAIRLKELGY